MLLLREIDPSVMLRNAEIQVIERRPAGKAIACHLQTASRSQTWLMRMTRQRKKPEQKPRRKHRIEKNRQKM